MNQPLQILSLGAGVQSSTLALMAARGEITPMPDASVFADTQAEPPSAEWRRLQSEDPEYFKKAVLLEKGFQQLKRLSGLTGQAYLHSKRIPLDQVDFSTEEERGQIDLFGNECEGMCGV